LEQERHLLDEIIFYANALFKNNNLFNKSGFIAFRFFVMILPAVENIRSEDADVAGIHRYFLAKDASFGYFDSLVFHQARGSSL
jgi:hypothetical protein